jgi:hypothetical protein
MRSHRLLFAGLLGAALTFGALQAAPARSGGPSVFGGGIVHVTDESDGFFKNAGLFAIVAGLHRNGSAYGHISFLFGGTFGTLWGACPIDPRCVPGTTTHSYSLQGDVTGVTSNGETVEVTGTLSEIDRNRRGRVVFEEHDVPFTITLEERSRSFVFQWCLLPPFTMDVGVGGLHVNASDTLASLLQRPGARPTGIAGAVVLPASMTSKMPRPCAAFGRG